MNNGKQRYAAQYHKAPSLAAAFYSVYGRQKWQTLRLNSKLHYIYTRLQMITKCTFTVDLMMCSHSFSQHGYMENCVRAIDLTVPRTRTVCFGNRSFRVAAPAVWNRLPPELKDSDISKDTFKAGLKTHLFQRAACLPVGSAPENFFI